MSAAVTPVTKNIPVAKPWIGAEEEAAVLEVLRSGWLSQGPKVLEFEQAFAQFVGAKHAIAVSSCTSALHLAMIAAGVSAGDEVICPSFSFIATANAIRYVGAEPIFVDIEPHTYNIDPERIEAAITPRTCAILAVHQIGMPADMEAINEVGSRHGLVVLEDAACAIGAEYRKSLIGAPHSQQACFSFHPRKILTTGEGGMITTSDDDIAGRLRRLRQHAMSVSDLARHSANQVMFETYDELGYNYRMTDLQAAVGLVQLLRVPAFLERRKHLATRYSRAFANLSWLETPFVPPDRSTNYQSYMVRLSTDGPVSRNAAMKRLLDVGIATRRGVMAAHSEAPYRGQSRDPLTQTTLATEQTLILPLFHEMQEADQDFIIETILGWDRDF